MPIPDIFRGKHSGISITFFGGELSAPSVTSLGGSIQYFVHEFNLL